MRDFQEYFRIMNFAKANNVILIAETEIFFLSEFPSKTFTRATVP